MKRSVAWVLVAIAIMPSLAFADLKGEAAKLFQSLSDEQRKAAALPFDSKERNSEVFPGGPRPGIPLKTLSAEQQKLVMNVLGEFTSKYGREKCEAISKQDPSDPGLGRYIVCFFGDPTKDDRWAWRLAEHHLTLVDVEMKSGEPATFGPILLGANPPTLWDDEEEKLIALYAAMSPEDRAKATRSGKGIASFKFEGTGVRVGDLSPSAKKAAQAMLDNRLSFFSEPIQQRVRKIIDAEGGIDAMQLAFFGEARKKCRDGGRWDFKLAGKTFLCDYEGSRAHIHMSMKGALIETGK
jgi:hypothetical protein